MDDNVIKKTQSSLGKYVKKPPLTQKLLSKPPFRFLHDIVTSIINSTGFAKGLYPDTDLNSENVKEKEAKLQFLQTIIDYVTFVTGKKLSARPIKIIAGAEPEKTNEFLQALAAAIGKQVDNEETLAKFRAKQTTEDSPPKNEPMERENTNSAGRQRPPNSPQDSPALRRVRTNKDSPKSSPNRERKSTKDKPPIAQSGSNDEPPAPAPTPSSTANQKSKHTRPNSAKGARRKQTSTADSRPAPAASGSDQPHLPPQVAAARHDKAPFQTGPAANNVLTTDMGADQSVNGPAVIRDTQLDDDDEFIVGAEVSTPAHSEMQFFQPPQTMLAEGKTGRDDDGNNDDDDEHGGLVKRIMETKKELNVGGKTVDQQKVSNDVQSHRERQLASKEIDKLKSTIQLLTRSALPLGATLDYLLEDFDTMQQELQRWRADSDQVQQQIVREDMLTRNKTNPLRVQLDELDAQIKHYNELIAAVTANIAQKQEEMEKLINSLTE